MNEAKEIAAMVDQAVEHLQQALWHGQKTTAICNRVRTAIGVLASVQEALVTIVMSALDAEGSGHHKKKTNRQ